MRLIIRIAAAAAALAAAMPACAQGYIVYRPRFVMNTINSEADRPERDCREGLAPTTEALAAARTAAIGSLERYVRLAAGPAPANAIAAFSFDAGRREWLRNGVPGSPDAVDDPLARVLAARGFAVPEPRSFRRSSDGFAALGTWWITADGETSPAGYYRVLFRLEGMRWNLQRLEVIEGEPPPQTRQFCHSPGDLGGEDAYYLAAPPPAERTPEEMRAQAEVGSASLAEAEAVRTHKGERRASETGKHQRLTAIAGGK
ncbi:MAG: hypothetical protein V4574_04610 [Pseudomonadota bacterium]